MVVVEGFLQLAIRVVFAQNADLKQSQFCTSHQQFPLANHRNTSTLLSLILAMPVLTGFALDELLSAVSAPLLLGSTHLTGLVESDR
jgi:hypothetical protein